MGVTGSRLPRPRQPLGQRPRAVLALRDKKCCGVAASAREPPCLYLPRPAAPRPWLIGIARNVRLNLRRGSRRQQAVAGRIMDEQTSVAAEDPQDEGSVVRAALAGLPERDREVLMLAVWDDLDREAIAAV